jgi:hypothetical protein
MGKASSAKKVARAAGLGGSRAYGARPPYVYYFAVLVLVVLGVIGVYNSREYANNKINAQGTGAPKVGQSPPWYEGYAVDICGKLLPPITSNKDPYGITTKGGGIISISPTVKSAAGHNATLGKFASAVGMTLNASEIQVPGGRLYQRGASCQGKPGNVYVMVWTSPQAPQSDGVLQDKKKVDVAKGYVDTCNPDCVSGVLLQNNQLLTIAFLPAPPKGKTPSILQPPQSVISTLTKTVAAAATTTVPATAPVTAPPTTAKTAKGATTVTTSKGATTTAATPKATTTSKAATPKATTTSKAATKATTSKAKAGTKSKAK